MDATDVLLHWLYVAVMAGSAIAILLMARKPKGVPQYKYTIHAFVVIWSGLAARCPRAGHRRGAMDPAL